MNGTGSEMMEDCCEWQKIYQANVGMSGKKTPF